MSDYLKDTVFPGVNFNVKFIVTYKGSLYVHVMCMSNVHCGCQLRWTHLGLTVLLKY